jgi:hypothetical protein
LGDNCLRRGARCASWRGQMGVRHQGRHDYRLDQLSRSSTGCHEHRDGGG